MSSQASSRKPKKNEGESGGLASPLRGRSPIRLGPGTVLGSPPLLAAVQAARAEQDTSGASDSGDHAQAAPVGPHAPAPGAAAIAAPPHAAMAPLAADSQFYSSFLRRHISTGSPLHFSSSAFKRFVPSQGSRISREALGLQTFVSPPSGLTVDTSRTNVQDALRQLQSRSAFDPAIFSGFVLPEDGISSDTVLALGKIFNQNLTSFCPT